MTEPLVFWPLLVVGVCAGVWLWGCSVNLIMTGEPLRLRDVADLFRGDQNA